ncbi:MAG: DNA polymerase III subunit delta' C-terminal domain-containing protein [Balneolaceae bacterium]
MTRFFDVDRLKQDRDAIVSYLRYSYVQDAVELTKLAQDWQSAHNIEGLISITNLMEMYIRDLIIYKETQNENLLTNIDQLDSIKKFVSSLTDARLEDMIHEVDQVRPMLKQNVSPKLTLTVLALRFSNLMRGNNPFIPAEENWKHLPAFAQ